MKICTIYGTVSDKIKSVVFAKQLAQEAAEREARKKTVMIVCICAGIALVAAGIAVGIYFLSKQECVKEKVNVIVANIKSKLPGKKNVEDEACECDFEECECECEVTDAPETVEE